MYYVCYNCGLLPTEIVCIYASDIYGMYVLLAPFLKCCSMYITSNSQERSNGIYNVVLPQQ